MPGDVGIQYLIGCFCFNIMQDHSRILCGRDACSFKRKFDPNTAKLSPFPALIVVGKNYCPYCLVV